MLETSLPPASDATVVQRCFDSAVVQAPPHPDQRTLQPCRVGSRLLPSLSLSLAHSWLASLSVAHSRLPSLAPTYALPRVHSWRLCHTHTHTSALTLSHFCSLSNIPSSPGSLPLMPSLSALHFCPLSLPSTSALSPTFVLSLSLLSPLAALSHSELNLFPGRRPPPLTGALGGPQTTAHTTVATVCCLAAALAT